MRARIGVAVLLAAAAAGCGGSSGGTEAEPTTQEAATAPATAEPLAQPSWPAPPNPLELATEAGLEPGRKETLVFHVHAHLDVLVDGQPVQVPGGVGINTADAGVQSGEFAGGAAYGGIELCEKPCISPLHTHDVTGIVHTESLGSTPNRLGQFFTEWGVRLDESCVGEYCAPDVPIEVYVDGELYEGNPADISLTDQKEIAIVIGARPAEIPSVYDFTGKA